MGERVASWKIGISGDEADITQFLSALKSRFQTSVAELEKISNSADIFSALQSNLGKIKGVIDENTARAAAFRAEIERTKAAGGDVSDTLTKGLAAAEKAAASATKEYARQNTELAKYQTIIKQAGGDTANLGAFQAKLAVATRQAADAAAVQASQQALGLKTLKDIQPEIQRLNIAYNTLVASGAGVKELAVAQQQLQSKTAELRASVTGAAQATQGLVSTAKVGAPEILSFFANTLLPAAGLTLSIGTLVAGLLSVVAAAREVRQATAEVGQTTNLTTAQLATLEQGAKGLADELGIGVVDALKQLREIIRSTGVGPEDAITVLRASATAAKGSVQDLGVVTRVTTDLMSAFGFSAGEAQRVLDGLIAGAQNGGPKLADLDGKIGSLAVSAKSAGVSANDLAAFLNVMVSASGDAAGSVSALQRLLIGFNTEKVQQGLADLGIKAKDFTGVMVELADRGIPVSKLIDLGVAGTKAAVGVEGLTRSATALTEALQRQSDAAGAGAVAFQKYLDSPQGKSDAFIAAWEKVKLSLGGIFGSGSAIQVGVTAVLLATARLLNIFHTMTPAEQEAALAAENLKLGWLGAADAAKVAAAETAAHTKALDDNKVKADGLAKTLGGLGTDLLANAAALQAASDRTIAAIQTAADAEIAAIDRTGKATAAGAAAKVQIQLDANEKIFQTIAINEARVTEVTEKGIAGRIVQLKADNKTKEQIEADILKIRLAAADAVDKQYQKLYASLEAQAKANVEAVNSIEAQRVSFAAQIEQAISAARGSALNAQYSDYLDREVRINALIAKARQEALTGDLAQAKSYSDQAVAEIGKLAPAYSANGTLVVTALQAQQEKITDLKKLDSEYGAALATRGTQAKKGADDTVEQLNRVKVPLQEAKDLIEATQKKALEGLNLEAKLVGVDKAKGELDALTKDRTINLIVKTIREDGTPVPAVPLVDQIPRGLNRGGYVDRVLQGFATGGPVFRAPSWSKVPGQGNGDTVPALLREGSFVMRKAASQYYGDGVMGKLVRGFASGGWVPPPSPVSPWASGASGTPATNESNRALHDLKAQADIEIYAMLSRAVGLPRSTSGQDVRDYLSRVRELISADSDVADATAYLDKLVTFYARFYPAIEIGKQWHQPVVMGVNVAEDKNPKTQGKGKSDKPPAGWSPWFTPGNPFGFARGGSVGGDTIPAMLTPGEHVINPPAVQFAQRMFGGGFLDALNQMRVPRGFMSDFAPPQPRRYADGGYVDGPGAPMRSLTALTGGGGNLTVNVYPQRFDERTFNEEIVPRFKRLQATSK